jgi:hypothetical protein
LWSTAAGDSLPSVTKLLGDIGTIEWSRRTNGILGRRERARFIAAVTFTTARVLPRTLAARAGMRGAGPDPSLLTPPDTPFAREVIEACGDLDPMVIEHGYRSYIFARALGVVEGIECDEEALFAGAILHDYAFSMLESLSDRCFTLAGAEVAEEILARSSLTFALQHDVLDAITLHLNPRVDKEQGELQHLIHDGILLDVLGARAWELDPEGVGRVVDRHPRHGFILRGEPLLRAHSRRVHGCRAGALFNAGFGPALRTSVWNHRERRMESAG